jgi:hypothetical protein
MFGYLKLDNHCPEQIQKSYKKYYCYLCRSLQAHYGFWARFILSYDVTLFLITVTDENYLSGVNKITCFNKEATKTYGLLHSKSIAAFTLILSYYKIKDDLNDDKSFKARLLYFLYKGKINKARKDFPLMDQILDEHYSKIALLEKKSATLLEIAEEFSKLLVEVAVKCFDLKDDMMLKGLRYVARWVYFIDALDDLDDDIKKNRFNPFKSMALSKEQLVNENYLVIKKHLDSLREEISELNFNKTINHQVLNRIIYYSVPDSTFNILKG